MFQSQEFDLIILKDKSIVRIYNDGTTFLFPNLKYWYKPYKSVKTGDGRYHRFEFNSKKQAKEIVTLLNILS